MSCYVEHCRFWRAAALKLGLDPETPVEDIMLLQTDDKGKLLVAENLEKASRALEYDNRSTHK